MDSYFVQYKKELLLLAFGALALIVFTVFFIYAMIKIVKRENEKIRNVRTMKLHSYMKLRNSWVQLFFSIVLSIGLIFSILVFFYIIKPEGFSLKLPIRSVIATYLLFTVMIFMLFSTLSDILYFFTTTVVIENDIIHIRYYLLRHYSICMKQVLSFSLLKGVNAYLPVGCLSFTSADGKKRKLFLYLSDESNIILSRLLYNFQLVRQTK